MPASPGRYWVGASLAPSPSSPHPASSRLRPAPRERIVPYPLLTPATLRAYSPRVAATTIAVLSQKGGTGKTTMVRTLADVFERLGLDVLAVDADPQGNLSDYFDADPNSH